MVCIRDIERNVFSEDTSTEDMDDDGDDDNHA